MAKPEVWLPGTAAFRGFACLAFVAALGGCASTSDGMSRAGSDIGADPVLVDPHRSVIPVIHIAPAAGWHDGATPVAGSGLQLQQFADGLVHPRWLYVLPNGDVLVAETNAPERPADRRGLRAWFMGRAMSKAGAGVASPDRITLLRDTDHDGIADSRYRFLENLHAPFGMTLVGDEFLVANTDAVLRFKYAPGATTVAGRGEKIVDLPAGPINHHWTKNVIATPDGTRLYVTVGSNSNAGERGLSVEQGRAAIWELDRRTGQFREFATGLRNPNGMAFEPHARHLWTVVNERDELGDDLVPDYLAKVQEGGNYGWPYTYYGSTADPRLEPPAAPTAAVSSSPLVPDYALGSHTGSLGLAFAMNLNDWPAPFSEGAFVGQHGSWNRREFNGYKVIFVPFRDGRPVGMPIDVLTGFLTSDGEAQGRPVGVALDGHEGLLVADDVGNVIWRVSSASSGKGSAVR